MAGQPDAADDLIAELAKLMAQDAKGDRPAEPAAPAFTVRIPGDDTPAAPAASAPTPRFDFDHTMAMAAERPAATVPAVPDEPVVAAPAPSAETPQPFRFDFDLATPRRSPVAAVPPGPPATPVAPAEQPAAPVLAAAVIDDHDGIADLIAAELSAEPISAPAASEPVAPPISPSTPQTGHGWVPTTVAANLGGQDKSARPELRALNLQPAPRPEQDRFKVPPVFGLGSKPVPVEPSVSPVVTEPAASERSAPFAGLHQPAPSVVPAAAPQDDGLGSDPIDEIEHLIGRAMRVEFDKPVETTGVERPVPSPALRSLATPTAPAAPVEDAAQAAPRALSGADEAILAAAQATGAEIGWVEAPEVDDAGAVAPPVRRGFRSRGMTRAVAGPLVAVTLLLAAGFGLYWVLGLGRDSGPAPLLTADTSPVKETPAVEPDAAAAPQSIVFNEINGVVPGAEEQLVSRDQADVNEVTQVPPTSDLSEEGLANRKVRTVTVRPDGTIVSGDESVAGSAILPVDRPNVPAVPGAETASPDLVASVQPEPAAPSTPEPAAATEAPVTPVTPGSTVPAIDLAGNLLAGKSAPVPMLRPAGLVQATAPTVTATSPVNAVIDTPAAGTGNLLPPPPANSTLGALPATRPAITQPAAQPAAATQIPGAMEVEALPNSAPAYAQLASLRSEEEARQAAQALVTRFGPLFGGANMEVQRVDLGARGIYYRVRVPAASTSAAGNICTNVIAAGGDCVPM
ncbi:hypothetical protein ASD04_02740 [Devosia sp. Root436]|uniref:SPOR domain-containing protein n=1 Tax=Devosia sp. Root436 TaxID=1736537 RepID=UPI0007007439|nr:SPOR domain-containing protein [Devosia sp. Root436]KQX42892.1 hypothetical protein ASD04_02740 [Devosia sp. Root436]